MSSSGVVTSLLVVAVLTAGTAIAGTSYAQVIAPAAVGAKKAPASQPDNAWSHEQFSLRGLDGVNHTLADWKGKVIMLNFWSTWCASCQAEISDFIAFQKEYQAKGLQVVGLGMDAEQKLRNVQRTLEINYPILIADPERNANLIKQWGNSSGIIPYTVVIDRDGRIIYTHRGPLHRDTFDENVLPLLGKS
jgi:peroxiredoxin